MKKQMKHFLNIIICLVLCGIIIMPTALANDDGLHNFVSANSYYDGQFADVSPMDWFSDEVRVSYELGLVKGESASSFNPNGNMRVSEAITLACRLHSIYHNNGTSFVQGSPWYQVYVDYAVDNAMITNDQFTNYDAYATRAEFAVLLASALPDEALPAINEIEVIPDVFGYETYSEAVYKLYNAGILTGNDAQGTFAPHSTIRRCEVAAIVSRMAIAEMRKTISISSTTQQEPTPSTPPTTCTHSWKNATCTMPKTCTVCGKTTGSATGHNWKDATCDAPKTCKNCGITEGSKLPPTIAIDDKTAPELISFTLDKTTVNIGDVINFTAEIIDTSTIYYAEFQFKCGADYHNVFLEHCGGNTYTGTLKITDSFVSGTYRISWISIQDYAGNTARPSSTVAFTVDNQGSSIVIDPNDETAPELISFTLDKANVTVGDVIKFTAEIVDNSTIDYAEFQFKCGADYHNVFLEHNGGNTYTGTLKITNSFVSGTYRISWISIQDYAGNTASPSSAATFTVDNQDSSIVIDPGDETAPKLISFTLDKTDVTVGDVIKFTAEIVDNSTIDYAEFQFKCGADYHNVFLEHNGGNTYIGTLKITDSFVSGTYRISWISIQDYAGNTASPSSNASFIVTR